MSRHPMESDEILRPEDYPFVVTLRFKDIGRAEDTLHEMEHECQSVRYNENEMGKNIYYIDGINET